jgi:ferric-dicitrate binding protein FerR (iron transport regulator)
MTNEDKIKKWLAEELSNSEKQEFERTEEFAKIDKLMKAAKAFRAPEYDIAKEQSRLLNKIHYKKETISLYERISPIFKIAAVFILVSIIGYFSYNYFESVSTANNWIADQTEVYLPDQSHVILNADSRIRFSEKKWRKVRNVELDGEAFFKVKKGSQFNVHTQHGKVTVLGTEFNVVDRENYYEVICYSGLVEVTANNSSVLLEPNSAFRIIHEKEEKYTISNKSEPDWLNGESSFRSVPFSFVINELERQYNVTVEANNINLNQLFTGGFSHDNIEIALEAITTPLDLNYKINENKIALTFESK